MYQHLSLASRILLVARRAGLRVGKDNTVDVLVRVQAPDAQAESVARPPQAVALVIDRSGSMAGPPLAEARRCAEFVVSRLRPADAVAVVQFDNRVQRLWPAVPLGDANYVRGAIGRIEAGGCTNLHGGWLDGAQALTAVPGSGVKRVVLLSDGGANDGLTDAAQIEAQCAAWAAQGITTSTYGLGDNFNESLMIGMARNGSGSHYYGETADDLMEPFQQELDLLTNLALRQLDLSVQPADGVRVEMLNMLPSSGRGWRLPDLAWGAEAWALLRLTVPAPALPAAGGWLALLRVSVAGRSLTGEPVALEKTALALPVLSAAACEALTDDELVHRRAVEVEAGQALMAMRAAADAGDWPTVDRLLSEARARYAQNAWVASIIESMIGLARERSRERAMKESMYASGKLHLRLAARDEMGDPHLGIANEEVPAFLRRKAMQGKKDL